jgi:hypothetical protein
VTSSPRIFFSKDMMRSSPRDDAPAPAGETVLVPSWGNPLGLDRRGWMVLGGIAAAGAVMGAALARDVHRSPLVMPVLVAAMVACTARAGWRWLRGPSRRARLREGVLSHVEDYGGGAYGMGAGITLLVLSAASLQESWMEAGGWMQFLRGMTLDWWWGFSGESIRNAVQAGIWPLHWYTEHGLAAALAVGAAAWAGDALATAWRRRDPLEDADPRAARIEPAGEEFGAPAAARMEPAGEGSRVALAAQAGR